MRNQPERELDHSPPHPNTLQFSLPKVLPCLKRTSTKRTSGTAWEP
jgi:hypothetical protein